LNKYSTTDRKLYSTQTEI